MAGQANVRRFSHTVHLSLRVSLGLEGTRYSMMGDSENLEL